MASSDCGGFTSRRPSLLPAFEPLSSSPGGLPRATKRKFADREDDRKYYPTPVPTSSTGILPSSPDHRSTRPNLQRNVSTLSERAPLGAVPSLDLPANGEPVLMGRSSNSSNYQLSANRLISRVHVRATYHAPTAKKLNGLVVVECMGWNGCKIHSRGQVVDLAKGEAFESDRHGAQIMVDVQDTRVLLLWPRQLSDGPPTRSPSFGRSPIKQRIRGEDAFASSPPPMFPSLRSPVSPSPAHVQTSTFASTFLAGQSFDDADDGPVQVYEDQDSPDDLPRCETPTPAVQLVPATANDAVPKMTLEESQTSSLSEPEELSEHDEENDPIVHSFGPFGDNLLAKFESFKSASPERRRNLLASSFPSLDSGDGSEASTTRMSKDSPIKNHIINQLAYSRVHSVPLSTIYSNLPAEMKGARSFSDTENRAALTTEELKVMLDMIPCVGEISREGKDAAGKPLENEFYYVPELDDDEPRRTAVSIGKPPLRNVRKQHKVRFSMWPL